MITLEFLAKIRRFAVGSWLCILKKGPTNVATSAPFFPHGRHLSARGHDHVSAGCPVSIWTLEGPLKMDWLKGTPMLGNHSWFQTSIFSYFSHFDRLHLVFTFISFIYLYTTFMTISSCQGCVMLEEIFMGWLLIPLVAAEKMEEIRLFIDKLSQKLVKEHLWILTGWLLRVFGLKWDCSEHGPCLSEQPLEN